MYYDIVNSGERIKELRAARRMTRQQLAEQIGLSVDALRNTDSISQERLNLLKKQENGTIRM